MAALTGLDVATDTNAQLTIQVALLILRIQGLLPEISTDAGSSHTTELLHEPGYETAQVLEAMKPTPLLADLMTPAAEIQAR